jgi:hypothetical protein
MGSIEYKAKMLLKIVPSSLGWGYTLPAFGGKDVGLREDLSWFGDVWSGEAVLIRNWPQALRHSSGESPTNVCD